MTKYAVLTTNLLDKIDEIKKQLGERKIVVTTLTFSKALKKGINPSIILDNDVWVRAYSHKPVKISGLDEADSESIMVALELSADLVTDDEKVEAIAKKMGVNVVRFPSLTS